jgi:hypothetical protein
MWNIIPFAELEVYSQTMDIADKAIHKVVCQKSDVHGNSDFLSSQKPDPI